MQMLGSGGGRGGDLQKEKEKKNVFQIHLQGFINMNDIGKHSHLHIYLPLRLSHEKLECLVPKGKTRTLIDYDLWC